MRPWKVALFVGALAVVGLFAAVAIASGADEARSGVQDHGAGQCDDEGTMRGGQRVGEESGTMRGLGASDEMQAWREEYGDDPTSTEAQSALQAIRDGHRADMQELMGQVGHGGAAEDCDSGDCKGVAANDRCDGAGVSYGQDGHGQGGGNGW